MDPRRVREIFQSLVQGVDPESGAVLPSDSVIQKTTVLRALIAGIEALAVAEKRAARRAQLPDNVGRSWSDAELAALRREFESGISVGQIATAHGRTVKAITARLEKMGLVAVQIDGWTHISGLGTSRSLSERASAPSPGTRINSSGE
jgi:hypothetical protein